ncbi:MULTISPECIES: DUF6587 family protein [unclassified Pseudoxanthomonas]|uniref:DUF6587 family protein n=1 Tax=unclassified Pseudoxanthomonas TaxID=2645906 RepID=UPI00307736B8
MSASLTLQYVIIAVAVLVSVWVVAKKQFPGSMRKLRVAVALRLLHESRPAWQRAIGRRIAPRGSASGAGCGGCSGCDTP